MNIVQIIKKTKSCLINAGVDRADRVSEELLAHFLDCKPLEIYLYDESLSAEQLMLFEKFVRRIENGEPFQYVVGSVNFLGLDLKCDSRALIPRPETELLVEEVLKSKRLKRENLTFVDVGTGSGCIVISLATKMPNSYFKAVDISNDALSLAKENAQKNRQESRIEWIHSSLLTDFLPKSCDAVVANLPYISTHDWESLSRCIRNFEPKLALDSGPTGVELIEELATQARSILTPKGLLFLEYGFDQGDAVFNCLQQRGYKNIQIKRDLAGLDRIAIAENPGN